jgi:menaquinone-dependent protoporphyrinogen oxidase
VAREIGHTADIRLCKDLPSDFALEAYNGVIVAAPVHNRKHEGAVVDFIRRHRAALESVPSAFLSVGLVPILPRFLRRKATAGVVAELLKETGWKPANVLMVAGAVMYRRYTPRQRLLFKCFMALLGGPTDTWRDHDLTDWASLRRFIQEFLAPLSEPARTGA